MSRWRLPLVALLLARSALAAPASIAVSPLDGLPAALASRWEAAIGRVLEKSIGLRLANQKGDRFQAPRGAAEARFAEDPLVRGLALGAAWEADLALAIDAAPLGDRLVVYLQGVDVARGKAIASTAVTLGPGAAGRALEDALFRALAPERHRCQLEVSADVVGATLWVDGTVGSLGAVQSLTCSTHAIRVTHPAYRNYLRFVALEHGPPTRLAVALSKYPVGEGELLARPVGPPGPIPWYRRWWVVGGASLVLFGVAAGVTATLISDSGFDQRVACCKLP